MVPGAAFTKKEHATGTVHCKEGRCYNLSVDVALNVRFTTNGMCAKNNTDKYVARTSNNRVTLSGDLTDFCCCLLPQCEALRTCATQQDQLKHIKTFICLLLKHIKIFFWSRTKEAIFRAALVTPGVFFLAHVFRVQCNNLKVYNNFPPNLNKCFIYQLIIYNCYCLFVPRIYGWCYSSRTSRSWWIAHSTQHQRRGCNSCLYLSPRWRFQLGMG